MPFFFDPEGAFWSKVDRSGGEDACWLWKRALYGVNGYGALKVWGRKVTAHRYAYELVYGPVPRGMEVCHRCNERRCVNPKHLYAGTRRQNVADAIAAGTHHFAPPSQLKGEDRWQTTLTNEEVLDIYQRVWSGESGKALAKEYHIDKRVVSQIKNGVTWAWLTGHRRDE